jgi:glycosyltransferase involved in cell wall biosynthesis
MSQILKNNINIAFGSVPKDSGTFTFYRNLRPSFEKHGITMYCVAVGKEQAELWEESYVDKNTVLLAEHTCNVKKQAQAFVNWCENMNIDMVMGINSEAILSAIPHLPKRIRVVSRCANAFDHGYRITMSGKDRLQAIFAITPRLQYDLTEKYDANPALMHLIPNGIDPLPFENASVTLRGQEDILQLGFLGRLEHNQKGVMHLPNLVKNLNALEVPFHLSIAGKGADREKLEQALDPWINTGQISFLGALTREDVPDFLAKTDIYIFPSHFEGCPNSLLEAMMAGCVSMAWTIKGITDYVLKEGETGFLHAVGDCVHMAKNISKLNDERILLRKISKQVAQDARLRFTPELTAAAYANVIKEVMSQPLLDIGPLSWNKFKPDVNFKQNTDFWLPRGVKKTIKNLISYIRI